jgi:hypothetical protein
MSKRRRENHNFEAISTTHEVVGRHDAEYKILFESFIGSDVALKNESVPSIIAAIKTYASTRKVDTRNFDLEIGVRSITMLLTAASRVESSRVIKHAHNNWSILPLARVEPVISKLLAVTSKRHLNELRRKSAEFDSMNVKNLLSTNRKPFHCTLDRSLHSSTRLNRIQKRIHLHQREAAFVTFHSPTKWRSLRPTSSWAFRSVNLLMVMRS